MLKGPVVQRQRRALRAQLRGSSTAKPGRPTHTVPPLIYPAEVLLNILWEAFLDKRSSPVSQQVPTLDPTPAPPSITTLVQRAQTFSSVTSPDSSSSPKNSTVDASSSTNVTEVTHASTAVLTAPTEAPTEAGKEALVYTLLLFTAAVICLIIIS